MRIRPVRRSIQSATALAAATMVALAGCGSAEDPPEPETSAVEQEDSADDGDPQDEATGQDDADTQDPQEQDPDEHTATEDEDGPAAVPGSDEGRSVVFIHIVEPERLVDHDGEKRLPGQDLAQILQDMGGPAGEPETGVEPASCENELRYVTGADVLCTVTPEFDGIEQEMTMYAQPIAAPGGGHGILYTADEPLTEDGRWATFNGNNEATAIGMGGAYGMDPIPAEQLVGDMQTVIGFDFTHEPIDNSQWTFTVQDCPSELTFEQLAPVRCTATHDETGAEHVAWALPGSFYGQEPGLIVSIEMVPAGE